MHKLSSLAGFLIGALLVTPNPAFSAKADDPAVRQLVEQAYYWQKKGRDDLATGVWQKLLLADPANADALIELGNIEMRAGRTQAAETFLNRAKALPNIPKRVGELETALAITRAKPGELASARKEAQAGNSEQAVVQYQSILGSNVKPEGQFGLEYYQTLGGAKGGWEEARRGLEGLAQKNPGDERYLIALARHLTYREATRREGIRQLAALASQTQRSDEVQKAWRQALVWLGARPGDTPLYAAYSKYFPNDSVLRERTREVRKPRVVYRPDPEQIIRQAGFKLLNSGDVAAAEQKFSALLQKNKRDADALGGLGIVRMRQERFAEAVELIDRATLLGGKSSRWAGAKRSAQYWLSLQPVLAAQANGSLVGQEKAIRQAIRLDADEPVGQVLLADLLAEQHEWREAELVYRKVLKKIPDHPAAFRGLMAVLVDAGRGQEALAQIQQLDPRTIEEMGGFNQLKAITLLKVAEADERAGNLENALSGFEDALLIDPSSTAVRLSLIRFYQRNGEQGAASALLENLQFVNPDLPEVQELEAAMLAEQGRWSDALRVLERIPPAKRSPNLVQEQKRFWVNVQVERGRQFYTNGKLHDAAAVLSRAEQAAGDDLGLLGVVAGAWMDTGQAAKALRLMRQAASKSVQVSTGARLQYAGMLLNMRLDVELLPLLRELADKGDLTTREQGDLNNLIVAYTLRQTDALREAGRMAEAYDLLMPVLQQSTDPRLQMALARLYNSAREPENALRIAEEVIAREPDNLEHRLFASSVALGMRDYNRAAEHIEVALSLAPDHPRVLATAGRIEKARGNLSRAMEYFKYAQVLEKDSRAFAGVPGNLALRLVDRQPTVEAIAPPVKQSKILPLPVGKRDAAASMFKDRSRYNDFSEPQVNPMRGVARDSLPLPPVQGSQRSVQPLPPIRTPSFSNRPLNNRIYPGVEEADVVKPVSLGFSNAGRYESLAVATQPYVAVSETTRAYPIPAQQVIAKERTVDDEIRDISLKFSPTLALGSGFRSRSGETGMSRLTSVEGTLEARLPIDFDGAMVLRITPVLLEAGKVDLSRTDVATRFGSVGQGSFLVPGAFQALSQSEQGVALSLSLQTNNLNVDIGTTPIGFPVQNIVGGVALMGDFQGVSLKGSLSQRPVTDSLLSYAGAVDPRTGNAWGGVLKTGAGIETTIGDESGGVYAGLGGYTLTGEKVKSNNMLEVGFGGYWQAYQSADTKLTLGLNMTGMAYQYNLSHFTLGHGGYFSPQRYVAFGVPFDVAGRRGRFAFQFGGDIGIRLIKQDDAAYYPDDPNLQTSWENTLDNLPSTLAGGYAKRYAGDESSGLGYKFFSKVEYSITDRLAIGGRFTTDNSRSYTQQQGLVYIRHAFDGLAKPITYPPKTLRLFSEREAL